MPRWAQAALCGVAWVAVNVVWTAVLGPSRLPAWLDLGVAVGVAYWVGAWMESRGVWMD